MLRQLLLLRQLDPVGTGRLLLLVTGALVLATMPLLRPSRESWPTIGLICGGMTALVLVSLVLPWARWPRWAALAFPVATLGGLAALGYATDGLAIAYAGIFVLSFAYIGLTQPARTAPWLLPYAGIAYLLMAGQVSVDILVRFGIVAFVWILLAEILAELITHHRTVEATLQHASFTDDLTGVGNRRGFEQRLTGVEPGDTVVLVDIDHFKVINDTRGHVAGDDVLRHFGQLLRDGVRAGDYVARYGGEEFVLLLPATAAHQAVEIVTRARSAWGHEQPSITFSAGVAVAAESRPPTEVVQAADEALYKAKAAGRNRDVVSAH